MVVGMAITLIGLGGCSRERGASVDAPPQAPPPSTTTASAPGPSDGGFQAPPDGQPPNGAATVNRQEVRR
jgi:hypothetical protein